MAYTAPTIGLLEFYMGDGSLTSPYTDMYIPAPVLEAEATTTFIAWGDIAPQPEITADVYNPIEIDCDINVQPELTAEGKVFKILDVEVKPSVSQIEGEATTTNIIDVSIEQKYSILEAYTTDVCDLVIPAPVIEAEALTQNIIDADFYHKKPVISGEATVWPIINVSFYTEPPKIDSVLISHTTINSDIAPQPEIQSTAVQTEKITTNFQPNAPQISAVMDNSIQFAAIKYDGSCKLRG